MPIPQFTSEGLLPLGIHDATEPEIRARFGDFQESDRRMRLFAKLVELVAAMRESELFDALVIDGSFVAAKPAPNDIDLIGVLRPGHDFEGDLPMFQYALVSRSLLRRRFGFDVLVAKPESDAYNGYVAFFSRVREAPELTKGLLRLRL